MGANFGRVHVGCHCSVQLLGAIAGQCWVPLLGSIAGVPLLGSTAGVPLLGCWGAIALWGAMAGCHCCVPLRGKIDRSVTPFSAAPFSIFEGSLNSKLPTIWRVEKQMKSR